jgi:exopolyphosphatase/guanosine-5'-triphosphate,3'-diphosphate pyrophosphatase
MRIAAVDIGTNTLLMTIAEFDADGRMHILHDAHNIVRLGENLSHSEVISEAALQRAVECIRGYRSVCDELGADIHVGVATSAVRNASNGSQVLQSLRTEFKGMLQCISGVEEAELTFAGSVPDEGGYVVLDIGGGSTEIVRGSNRQVEHRVSHEIGAVMLHDRVLHSFPASKDSIATACALIQHCAPVMPISQSGSDDGTKEFRSDEDAESNWIAVAGTPTTLALVAQQLPYTQVEASHGYRLTLQTVSALCERLMNTPKNELQDIPGIHPQRADILPAGTLILREIMRSHQCEYVTVSTRGLRYGVVLRAYAAASRR